MDAIDLDPGAYRGTYKLVGGRPSLDLVNTISWPDTARAHDWLDSPGNIRRWLQVTGLPEPSGEVDAAAAAGIRTLLADVLRPLAHGESPPVVAVGKLNDAIGRAGARRVIDPATLGWRWIDPVTVQDALAPVLLDAAELVTAGPRERLRYCPSCDWLFEDQTRNGQRRWCDMADCGSRDKAKRYYRRTKSG
jgi:predicted RNA-binding Zn ribbon-like protein